MSATLQAATVARTHHVKTAIARAPRRGVRRGGGVSGGAQVYGDQGTLVGMGYYQTVSTRSAGFQLMDLRRCNQARRAGLGET
jgi:hypothetical protein